MSEAMRPLKRKSYGSIGHLPQSRLGPGDHKVTAGQARICLEKPRDTHDLIICQEKLDGSNTAVCLVDGQIVALGRAGYLAETSRFEMHRRFAEWVRKQESRFRSILREGERLVGEWLLQAHGTRYDCPHEPWVPFDLMVGETRFPYGQFVERAHRGDFVHPRLLHYSNGIACPLAHVRKLIRRSGHGALDAVEGAVWRVERNGKVDYLAKWVSPLKVDGCYLPEVTGAGPVWNTFPEDAA